MAFFFRADEKGRFSPNRSDGGSIVDSVPAGGAAGLPLAYGPGSGGRRGVVMPGLFGDWDSAFLGRCDFDSQVYALYFR